MTYNWIYAFMDVVIFVVLSLLLLLGYYLIARSTHAEAFSRPNAQPVTITNNVCVSAPVLYWLPVGLQLARINYTTAYRIVVSKCKLYKNTILASIVFFVQCTFTDNNPISHCVVNSNVITIKYQNRITVCFFVEQNSTRSLLYYCDLN